jgi:hypothetical protein
MAPIALRPFALLPLLAALAASAGCSLVASTDCTDKPGICPDGTSCVAQRCVPDADADADTDTDADVDSDADGDAEVDAEVDADGRFPCNIYDGSGCPDGELCTAYSTVGTGGAAEVGCLPEPSPALGPGETCSFTASGDVFRSACRGGTVCLPRYGGDHLECTTLCRNGQQAMCTGDYTSADGGVLNGICVASISDDVLQLPVCYRPDECDPRCRDCTRSLSCILLDDGVNHAYVCAEPGSQAKGDSCTYTYQCDRGLYCDTSSCATYCTLEGQTRPVCVVEELVECTPVVEQCDESGSYTDLFHDQGIGVCRRR